MLHGSIIHERLKLSKSGVLEGGEDSLLLLRFENEFKIWIIHVRLARAVLSGRPEVQPYERQLSLLGNIFSVVGLSVF